MRQRLRVLLGLVLTGGLSIAPLYSISTTHAASVANHAARSSVGARVSAPAKSTRVLSRPLLKVVGSDNGGIHTHADVANGQVQVYFAPEDLAGRLGISTATLQQDLQSGETLLQIAGSSYSTAGDLASALIAPFRAKMDHGVAAGVFSADQANQQYAAMLSSVETLVITPHPQLASATDGANEAIAGKTAAPGDLQPPTELGAAKAAAFNAIAASCNTTASAFGAALQAGDRTPMVICQSTNPGATVDSVSAAITTALTNQLNADVSAGKTTAAEANSILTAIQGHTSVWLTTAPNMRKS